MNRENKELLIKDLCARLLFGIKIKIGGHSDYKLIGIVITDEHPIKVEVTENGIPYKIEVSPDIIKPYLRPMSSMTEEEKGEVSILLNYEFYIDDDCALVAEDDRHRIRLDLMQIYIDWLNAHHFDYRGLIERGFAIEVTEENNPYKD